MMEQLDLFGEHYSIKYTDPTSQVCKVCGEDKHVSLFPKHKLFKTGLDNRCKACIKEQTQLRNDLKKEYSHLQPDVCHCCGATHHKAFVLDHDHVTNAFRGWICEDCNLGIGKLGDSVDGVTKALAYLESHYGSS